MRKLLVVTVVTLVGVGAAVLTLSGATAAEQQTSTAVPDSVAATKLTVADSASLKGPRQPIFFRHDIHAGQYKIQCQYCHYSVEYTTEPGIPSMQTCMGCHLAVGSADSANLTEIRKLRKAWSAKEPVQWTRVHTLAKHVHFPHMRHIKVLGPNACQTCHGDVARMPQVFKVNNINNMGFCISCHLERKVNRDCTACHY
jgi:Cytochrome c7 and related cytochrome c/Class III cytochrome C family